MRQRLLLGSLSDAAMRPAEVIDVDHRLLEAGSGQPKIRESLGNEASGSLLIIPLGELHIDP